MFICFYEHRIDTRKTNAGGWPRLYFKYVESSDTKHYKIVYRYQKDENTQGIECSLSFSADSPNFNMPEYVDRFVLKNLNIDMYKKTVPGTKPYQQPAYRFYFLTNDCIKEISVIENLTTYKEKPALFFQTTDSNKKKRLCILTFPSRDHAIKFLEMNQDLNQIIKEFYEKLIKEEK